MFRLKGRKMEEERKNELLESPLYEFVKKGWRKWSQKIVAVQAGDEDFLLFLVWTLDTIKAQDEGCNAELRDRVYNGLREHFRVRQFNTNADDLKYLTDLVCAAALACLGLTLSGSVTNPDIYSGIVKGLGEHWKGIEELKYRAAMDTGNPELKAWMAEYMAGEQFYTYSNAIEWDNEDMAEQIIKRRKGFKLIDLYRVIIGLYENNAFQSADGSKLTLNKVFQAFGDMLGEDYSSFNNNLSSASANKNEVDIFQRLKDGLEAYESTKDEKLRKQGKPIRR